MSTPTEIASALEGQVSEMLSLYDLAENAYSYQKIRGSEVRDLNEDSHRRSMVAFSHYGAGSEQAIAGNMAWGFGAMYLLSRRGAAHMLDFSTVRKCYWRSFGLYMIGVSLGSLYGVQKVASENSAHAINLHRRVHQNEQTHSILRSMKFHLATRQMGLWDVDPR